MTAFATSTEQCKIDAEQEGWNELDIGEIGGKHGIREHAVVLARLGLQEAVNVLQILGAAMWII